MSKKLIMCHGLPGAGKSTWARRYAEANQDVVIVNKSDIRAEIAGEQHRYNFSVSKVEKRVSSTQEECIRQALSDDSVQAIVSDDTNLSIKEMRSLWRIADQYKAEVEHKYFDVPVETCKVRILERARAGVAVPSSGDIDAMASKTYDAPIRLFGDSMVEEPGHIKHFIRDKNGQVMLVSHIHQGSVDLDAFNQAANLAYPVRGNAVVILDADGTLFNNNDDAEKYLRNSKKRDFHGFYNSIVDAPVNQKVLKMVQGMRDCDGLSIFLVTGRTDNYAQPLIEAVSRSGAPVSRIIMKRAGDMRPSSDHKQEVLARLESEGFVIVHAIDDRDKDIQMFRSHGVMVSEVHVPVDGNEPEVTTSYGTGRCIRCGKPLSDGSSIGKVCRSKLRI